MPPSSAEMARRGRIGGLTTASRHDAEIHTRPARAAAWERFLDLVDPERQLPAAERERRAKASQKARMHQLARLSALKRATAADVRRVAVRRAVARVAIKVCTGAQS